MSESKTKTNELARTAAASAYRIACVCLENMHGSARALPSLESGYLFEPELRIA